MSAHFENPELGPFPLNGEIQMLARDPDAFFD
jgi:hypothetical protein